MRRRGPILRFFRISTSVLFTVLVVLVMAVGAAEPNAQQILDSVGGSGTLSVNGSASVVVTVTNKQGQKKTQGLDIFRFDDGKGTTKQLIVFTSPADVKGTKFLSTATPKEGTQMWLYLPVIGRERVIAGSAVQGKFMGTDFTFEEISATTSFAKNYTPQKLADQVVDGQSCYVLKLTPKKSGGDYSYIRIAVHKQSMIPLSIEFYDRSQKLSKTLTSRDIRRSSRGGWQPYELTLRDERSGSTTLVQFLQVVDRAVPDEYFTLRYLRR